MPPVESVWDAVAGALFIVGILAVLYVLCALLWVVA